MKNNKSTQILVSVLIIAEFLQRFPYADLLYGVHLLETLLTMFVMWIAHETNRHVRITCLQC